jgi:hypothetical protein
LTVSFRYIKNEDLIGVIYLHKVSDNRFSGSSKRNLRTFKAICGDGYSPRICLATTCWAKKEDERGYEDDDQKHHELIKAKWEELIANNAMVFEIKDKSEKYPIQILDRILQIGESETRKVCLQLEIAKDKKKIHETSAGKVLDGAILERIKQLEADKKRFEDALGKRPKDEALKDGLHYVKFEIRLLKSRRARLRGNLGGIILHSILPF